MAEEQPPPVAAADPAAPAPPAGATGGNALLNERTYQEVEYLKRNLGPILVAALAEICIRRPNDPIEYLGHWLLRWRYNEELKRRDVQNALETIRRKTWQDGPKDGDAPLIPADAPNAESYGEGFVPDHPYAPTGYGGPLSNEQLKSITDEQQAAAAAQAAAEAGGQGSGEINPEGAEGAEPPLEGTSSGEKRASAEKKSSVKSQGSGEKKGSGSLQGKSSSSERRSIPASGSGEKRSGSLGASGSGEKRASGEDKRSSAESKRASGGSIKQAGSGEQPKLSNASQGGEARGSQEAPPMEEEPLV